MGLSRLSEKCRKCPFVDKYNHKRMEALAYLPEPQIAMNVAQSAGVDAAQPLLRETMTIHIAGKPDVKNCTTCAEAIFCSSWGRYRCNIRKIRIRLDDNECAYCGLYKKGKPDADCQCKTCMERSREDD